MTQWHLSPGRIFDSLKSAIKGLCVVILFTLWGCNKNLDQLQETRPVAVRVTKPAVMDLSHRLSYMGRIQSRKDVKIIAQVPGTVIDLPVKEGGNVSVGNVVARIDAPELQAAVERLQADKEYWCRRYEADSRLMEMEALPREQMESSKRACLSASAALTEAKSRLAKTVEKSPVQGEVLKWFVESGQSVMSGQPILLLGSDSLEIQVDVIEEDLGRGIAPGIRAVIELGAGNQSESFVSEIAPVSTGFSRTFSVKLPITRSPRNHLRNGASVNVSFILGTSKGELAVPVTAVASRDLDSHIFVIKDEHAFRQPVTLGIEQKGWIAVSFPWNKTDFIATSNLSNLDDGTPVFSVAVEGAQP